MSDNESFTMNSDSDSDTYHEVNDEVKDEVKESDSQLLHESITKSVNEIQNFNKQMSKKRKLFLKKLKQTTKNDDLEKLKTELNKIIESFTLFNDAYNTNQKASNVIFTEIKKYVKKHKDKPKKKRTNTSSGLMKAKKIYSTTFTKLFGKNEALSYNDALKLITKYYKDNKLNDYTYTDDSGKEKKNGSYFKLDKELKKVFPSYTKVFKEQDTDRKNKLVIKKDRSFYISRACANRLLKLDVFAEN